MLLVYFILIAAGLIHIGNGESLNSTNSTISSADELNALLDRLENAPSTCSSTITVCARRWMSMYNQVLSKLGPKSSLLSFTFKTNMTVDNQKALNNFNSFGNRLSKISTQIAKNYLKLGKDLPPDIKRMLVLASSGISSENENDLAELSRGLNELKAIFAKTRVFDEKNNRSLSLEPELNEIIEESNDYDKLTWAWKSWHEASGRRLRKLFTTAVELANKAARESGYRDLSEVWIEELEDNKLEETMDRLLQKIMPLYKQLHTYVKRKLDTLYSSYYPQYHDFKYIPAHLLGEMNAQDWTHIYDLVVPYPNAKRVNLTTILNERNYTVIDMFKEAEKFFTSIGMFKMTEKFWKYSMFEKPTNRPVDCHASAFDLFTNDDFRIKMCTRVDETNFRTIHHEMGHIEYYMAYSNQPGVFKDGANSGFHEAIGDTIALSAITHKHLKNIGLISDDTLTHEIEINFLMKMALKKIAILPFAYTIDKWRWNVFRGVINESNYNSEWWRLKKEYQGLEEPVERSEIDFDPGAKYHIPNWVPYARYFISDILQFQFFKRMCILAGHGIEKLHECDFYNSKQAGAEFKKMLELGSSKHWKVALKQFIGEENLDAQAFLDYFKPLGDWLIAENNRTSNLMST